MGDSKEGVVFVPRLNSSDVIFAEKLNPESFRKLLARVNTTQKKITRGNACTRCKAKKSKCDGQRPCRSCAKIGVSCDGGGSQPSAFEAPSAAEFFGPFRAQIQQDIQRMKPRVDWPVSAPAIYSFPRRAEDYRNTPVECLPLMFGYDSGIPRADMIAMVTGMPPELRLAMRKLSARLPLFKPPAHLPKMPKVSSRELWSTDKFCHTVHKVDEDGMQLAFQCNETFSRLQGAHPEEIGARMADRCLPPMFSQWRCLCYQLHLILILAGLAPLPPSSIPKSGEPVQIQLIFLVSPNNVANSKLHPSQRTKTNVFHRVSFKSWSDGVTTTAATLTGGEYDRAVKAHPECTQVFVDDEVSGDQLLAMDTAQEENLMRMARTPEGVRRMQTLAAKITRWFRLDEPLPPESLSSFSPSTSPALDSPAADFSPSPPIPGFSPDPLSRPPSLPKEQMKERMTTMLSAANLLPEAVSNPGGPSVDTSGYFGGVESLR